MKTLLVRNEEGVTTVLETRSGKFAGLIAEPGLHLVPPWKKVASRLTTHDFSGLTGINARTREQTNILVSVAMNFTIQDAEKYHKAAKEPYKAAVEEICAAAREIVGGIGFEKVWEDRGFIAQKVHAKAAPVLREKFGMAFNDIIVQQISHDSMCMSVPNERLDKMMACIAAEPDRIAETMGQGIGNDISVRKPLVLKR
jgi:regulator of protease activity HflC (stomatin/prohibitin superfamily)